MKQFAQERDIGYSELVNLLYPLKLAGLLKKGNKGKWLLFSYNEEEISLINAAIDNVKKGRLGACEQGVKSVYGEGSDEYSLYMKAIKQFRYDRHERVKRARGMRPIKRYFDVYKTPISKILINAQKIIERKQAPEIRLSYAIFGEPYSQFYYTGRYHYKNYHYKNKEWRADLSDIMSCFDGFKIKFDIEPELADIVKFIQEQVDKSNLKACTESAVGYLSEFVRMNDDRKDALIGAYEEAFQCLRPREAFNLKRYFGFGESHLGLETFEHGTPFTYNEIAKMTGYSRSRPQQIIMKAVRKLRHPTRREKIKEILLKR